MSWKHILPLLWAVGGLAHSEQPHEESHSHDVAGCVKCPQAAGKIVFNAGSVQNGYAVCQVPGEGGSLRRCIYSMQDGSFHAWESDDGKGLIEVHHDTDTASGSFCPVSVEVLVSGRANNTPGEIVVCPATSGTATSPLPPSETPVPEPGAPTNATSPRAKCEQTVKKWEDGCETAQNILDIAGLPCGGLMDAQGLMMFAVDKALDYQKKQANETVEPDTLGDVQAFLGIAGTMWMQLGKVKSLDLHFLAKTSWFGTKLISRMAPGYGWYCTAVDVGQLASWMCEKGAGPLLNCKSKPARRSLSTRNQISAMSHAMRASLLKRSDNACEDFTKSINPALCKIKTQVCDPETQTAINLGVTPDQAKAAVQACLDQKAFADVAAALCSARDALDKVKQHCGPGGILAGAPPISVDAPPENFTWNNTAGEPVSVDDYVTSDNPWNAVSFTLPEPKNETQKNGPIHVDPPSAFSNAGRVSAPLLLVLAGAMSTLLA